MSNTPALPHSVPSLIPASAGHIDTRTTEDAHRATPTGRAAHQSDTPHPAHPTEAFSAPSPQTH
ncbi:hypothetical protein STXM2123_5681 [Streptomyces sp. F-3]|nr:hypothetical protein STXM2123_5681 [Streptomyces sp. F-3]